MNGRTGGIHRPEAAIDGCAVSNELINWEATLIQITSYPIQPDFSFSYMFHFHHPTLFPTDEYAHP